MANAGIAGPWALGRTVPTGDDHRVTVPVELLGLFLDHTSGSSIALLGEQNEVTQVLPIFIGPAEAQSIAIGLQGIDLPRPGTHDLMIDVIELMGGRLERVVITALEQGTFLAELVIDTPTGALTVSSRPSDGLALAVRRGAPVHVEQTVLDDAAVAVHHELDQPFDEEEIEDIMTEFSAFLEGATPEDFSLRDDAGPPDEAGPPEETGDNEAG